MIDFSHENIVRVYDHFKQASSFYIVQEFVDGCFGGYTSEKRNDTLI